MIPNESDEIWTLLVTGRKQYKFQVVPANMLLARMMRSTQRDSSPENIQKCVEETYKFFVRYQAILTDDIKKLFDSQGQSK